VGSRVETTSYVIGVTRSPSVGRSQVIVACEPFWVAPVRVKVTLLGTPGASTLVEPPSVMDQYLPPVVRLTNVARARAAAAVTVG
jgi:hypothetical protein